jgi:clan AA aspartic protease
VVDTGFTGSLTLASSAVGALGLPYFEDIVTTLADDSTVVLPVHKATIKWLDGDRGAFILATGSRPLLGTALLDGAELVVQFTEGGTVTVEEL